jgi:hypothetical protein
LLAATDGRLDLGILAAMGFLAVGATEIIVTRKLPAPPWFNLAWWAVRTFTTFESKVMEAPTAPRRAPVVHLSHSRPHARARVPRPLGTGPTRS